MKFLIVGFLFFAFQAHASWIVGDGNVVCSNAPKPGDKTIKGGVNPWPWGQEIMFPWTGIQGVWQVSNARCSSLFMFKVGSEVGSEKYISITQYDPKQCKTVASGVGYESDRVVRAVLTGDKGSFEMTIHAFKESDLKASLTTGPVVVMKMRKMGTSSVPKTGYRLERLQKSVKMVCEE